MGLYNLQDPYGLSTWQENQGAYDLNAGTDLLLDQTRAILESDAYVFQAMAFPRGRDIFIAPGETFSGSINLTPFSYIVSLTGFTASFDPNAQFSYNLQNPFVLRIFDKGAQTDLYYSQFAWFPTVISGMQPAFDNTTGRFGFNGQVDEPFGPYFFRDPLIVLPPGVLQIQITNVAQGDAARVTTGILQMVLSVAVPKSTVSLQNQKITSGTDQSGLASLLGGFLGGAAGL